MTAELRIAEEEYRESVARIRETVPSHWLLDKRSERPSKSQIKAVEIALDELESYVGVMSQDIVEIESEARLERLRWAVRKLHEVLRSWHDS